MLPRTLTSFASDEPHDEALLRVNEMPESARVPDETVERFRDRGFGRGIDQQLRDLIGEIVAGRAVNWPVFAQRFVAGQNFFQHQIDARRPSRGNRSRALSRNAAAVSRNIR